MKAYVAQVLRWAGKDFCMSVLQLAGEHIWLAMLPLALKDSWVIISDLVDVLQILRSHIHCILSYGERKNCRFAC